MALTVATTQGLPAHLATLLEQHGLTHPSDILCLTMLDLIEVLNITATEAQASTVHLCRRVHNKVLAIVPDKCWPCSRFS
jgi:hypothetical protein